MRRSQALAFVLFVAVVFGGGAIACENPRLGVAELVADRHRAVGFVGKSDYAQIGWAVEGAGDLNGDGFDDFAIESPTENTVYIVFGRSVAEWTTAVFNFSKVDPSSWIAIKGEGIGATYIGELGMASGNFNGDEFGDLFISTTSSGMAFCMYGHNGTWSSFDIGQIESGSVAGFAVSGEFAPMNTGNAGDMNGDGIDDLLVSNAGTSVVIFGLAGATRGTFGLSSVDGTNGFSLSDETGDIGNSRSMGPAGDVNGDGLVDLALGSMIADGYAGRAYVLFARNVSASGQLWPASLNLTTELDGTNGFAVKGSSANSFRLGNTVVSAGDVNADGFDDVFIGSMNTGAWILFGHPAPWTSPFNLAQINGSNGFHFASLAEENWSYSGGGAGDFNGDGFDDILFSGYSANSTGSSTGAAAIVFGRAGSWPAVFSRKDAVGSMGFLVEGLFSGSMFGHSAHGAGDVNGDGLADFIVGSPRHISFEGFTLLVFGVPDDHCEVCSNFTGSCLVCDEGFVLNGTSCEAGLPFSSFSSASSSSATQSSSSLFSSSSTSQSSVVVIINFNENISDPTELQEEIASVLGIDAGLVSVVVISPTEVEVTIIGSEETAQHLVDIINNGGSGSGLGLLRKAIDAHIRKDTDGDGNGSSDDDGVDAAPRENLPATKTLVLLVVALLLLAMM